jgi:AraC family transcriptional activator of tynA and feaB
MNIFAIGKRRTLGRSEWNAKIARATSVLCLSESDCNSDMVSETHTGAPRIAIDLEAEGTSLSRHIWGRRLERCAEQLIDASLRCRSVSQIAVDNGSNDLSHFSKAFRQRYGMSPRAYRAAPANEI